MTVNDVTTTGLIDSGSQVSIVSESFFRDHLIGLELQDLGNQLRVTGAGGHVVPYLGYVEANVCLPCEVVGTNACVRTFLLVCPDTAYTSKVPVIVGTNTLRLVSKQCEQVAGKRFTTVLPMCGEVAFMLQDLTKNESGRLGSVKLTSKNVVIPAGETVEVSGITRAEVPGTQDSVLIQEPVIQPLHEGLQVISCKVPATCLPRLRILMRNVSNVDIVLKKRQVIADMFSIHAEYSLGRVLDVIGLDKSEGEDENVTLVQSFTTTVPPQSESPNEPIQFTFGSDTPTDWHKSFSPKLQAFEEVFIKSDFDIERADLEEKFDIKLEPGPQIRQRARPIAPRDFEDCRKHIQGLLDAKIIRPSNSPYASPIVLCRKKNFDLRMCCDYRLINARTIRDSYSVPKIEDLFLTLSEAKYFTSLDLCKAYYQIPMTEQASQISAFITPFGLFEWDRLSQGLVNAPACFQRIMETVFRDMNLTELIIFLDDILLHGKTLEELEERTLKVLALLRNRKLKLDPTKCIFGTSEIRHLGYIISEGSIRPDPDKIAAVSSWPKPTTVKEIKSFVGFAGFYRRFIPNFSDLVKPLNDLTIGYVPYKCRSVKTKRKGNSVLNLSSDISGSWGEKHDLAFEKVRSALTSDLVLGIADKSRPFFLHCDASGTGLGAVLYQEKHGQMRVIAYASRGLNCSEKNYPAHKREFLALKWAMTDKFRDYLLGSKVTVVTDNNPLCYVLKNAKLDATSHRWLSDLSLFDFELRYKKGSNHIDADSLSRRSHEPLEEDEEYLQTVEKVDFLIKKAKIFEESPENSVFVSSDSVQAVFLSHQVDKSPSAHTCHQSVGMPDFSGFFNSDNFSPAVEQLVKDPSLIPENVLDPKFLDSIPISPSEWRKHQLADRNLKIVLDHLEQKKVLNASSLDSQELKVFAREQKKLFLLDGVLYRKIEDDEQSRWQLVLPAAYRKR